MKRIELHKNDLLSFSSMCLFGFILICMGLLIVSHMPQVYKDIIVETTASRGTNESGELGVFWSILFLGIPILILLHTFLNRKKKVHTIKEIPFSIGAQIVINVANIIYFIIYNNFHIALLFLSVLFWANQMLCPEKEKENLVLPILIYYFLLSLMAIANFLILPRCLNDLTILFFAAILDIMIIGIERKKKIRNKFILIAQIFIPFLFFLYLNSRYIYQGEILYLPLPFLANVFLIGWMSFAFFYGVFQCFKNWNQCNDLSISKLLSLPTCMTLFAVNSISIDMSLVLPLDFHHPAEDILSFQQIVSKSQIPYVDYSPASGLFPFFIGFFLELMGGGMTAFNVAHNLFLMIFAMASVYFLSKYLSKESLFFAVLLFAYVDYDRVVFVLLTLLILFLPKLKEKPNTWLKCWLWLCFLGGIYYPTYGGATLIGTIPLGISICTQYIKSGKLKKDFQKVSFYIGWIVTLLPILLCFPMLLSMVKHVLAYSSQTVLADGISVYGQQLPAFFLSGLSIPFKIKLILYYGIRYLLPMAFVWLGVLFMKKIKDKTKWKELIHQESFQQVFAMTMIFIVTYTYTMVRSDGGLLLARPMYLIVLIGGMFFYMVILRHVKPNVLSYCLIGFLFGISLLVNYSTHVGNNLKTRYAYSLDENDVFITDELKSTYPRLGNGFIHSSSLKVLEEKRKAYELLKYDKNLSFIAWGNLMIYYVLDLKTIGQPSLGAVKSYESHEEIIEAIKKHRPVVGMDFGSSLTNYYLYYWILNNESYVYDEYYQALLPIELYQKIYGDKVPTNKSEFPTYLTNIKRIANSLGKSLETLKPRLTLVEPKKVMKENGNEKQIIFQNNVLGTEADFLYLKYDTKKLQKEAWDKLGLFSKLTNIYTNDEQMVRISWGAEEKDSFTVSLGTGELLIPLGSNVNWLLKSHKEFTITLFPIEEEISLEEMKFYKLKQIDE